MSITPRQHAILAQMHLLRAGISRNMSELQTMMLRLQGLETEWLSECMRADADTPPIPSHAATCTVSKEASDQAGGAGLEVPGYSARSEEESADELRVRNEPEVDEPASGAAAGVVEELPPLPSRELSTRAGKREAILDLWGRGETTTAITEALGVTAKSVESIVRTARKNGDQRAMVRAPARPKGMKAKREEIISLRDEGKSYRKIAGIVGASMTTVGTAIAEHEAAKPSPKNGFITGEWKSPIERVYEAAAQRAEKEARAEPSDLGEGQVVVVVDGAVHARKGIEDRFGPKERAVLKHMAKGELFHEFTLRGKAGDTEEGVFRYLMNGMRPKLAAIGVELFQPMPGHWRIRELEESV